MPAKNSKILSSPNTKSIYKYVYFFIATFFLTLLPPSFTQNSPEDKARQHYRLGQIYYEHGLKEEAEREFQKALDILKEKPLVTVQEEEIEEEIPRAGQPQPSEGGYEYTIARGDVLYISVWENPDLTQDVIVRPDGKISFPLIGEIKAQGLTIPALDNIITKKLKDYIRYPDVSVSLKSMGGERVIVLGEVNRPGVYSLGDKRTVLEVIALAGGFTDDAVLNSVVVVKGGLKKPKAERINLALALKKGKIKEDVRLRAQDIVYVPKKFIANVNYYMSKILDPIYKGTTTASDIKHFQR
jgi:polysaccharide export outer membrane protein